MTRLPFDGVLCLGSSDWWYHPHGRTDIRLVHELARQVPVLYVNSIGMRVPSPSEGTMFAHRMRRKLASIGRGLVPVAPGLTVYSPFVVPGRLGWRAAPALLRIQLAWALRRLGIRRPLLWAAIPSAAVILEALRFSGIVYQRTDRYEAFPGVAPGAIGAFDRRLKGRADLTFFSSQVLYEEEKHQCRRARFLDHGVDFDRFAASAAAEEPEDVRPTPRPRVGFIGSLDAHTLDPELLADVVGRLPDHQFVLVGGSSLPEGWCRAANLHELGRKPYEDVWRYPGACDVLIMPWRQSAWIEACNPIKLKEYLATGRPVVTSDFPGLAPYRDCVRVASGAADFARAVREAAAEADPAAAARRQERVRAETWTRRSEEVLAALRDVLS